MGWLVLSVVLGVLVWAILSGRLTLDWRRALSWWLDVGDGNRLPPPAPPTEAPPAEEAGGPARLFARLASAMQGLRARRAEDAAYEAIEPRAPAAWPPVPSATTATPFDDRVPPRVCAGGAAESAAGTPPAAVPVPPSARPAPVAEPAPEVPVIGLQDVAQNLQKRHYRQQAVPVAPETLPLLDGKAIRDNLLGRVRHVPAPAPETTLPVIGPAEVEQNLQSLGARHRAVSSGAPADTAPLPMIDADEIRASLRQIHGARLKARASEPPEPPLVRQAVEPPQPEPSAPASPLLRSRREPERPARFVEMRTHATEAVPDDLPEMPAVAPRPAVMPVQVLPRVARPDVRVVPPAVPQAPVVPEVRAQVVPPAAPRRRPDTETASLPMPASHLPTAAPDFRVAMSDPLPVSEAPSVPHAPGASADTRASAAFLHPPLSGALAPVEPAEPVVPIEPLEAAPRAPSASGLVWHVIEEREPSPPPVETDGVEAAPAPVLPWVAVAADAPAVPPPAPRPSPVWDDSCLPSLDLLRPADPPREVCSEESLIERGIVIEEKLGEFKVKVSVVDACAGPVITRFEVEPAVGVRGSQVVNLVKDLARALGLASIRVVETIPGKTCMGLELPNPVRQMIRLSEILSAPVFTDSGTRLTLALGKDITGEPVVMDLAKAPHLLVAGTTGSGKSVGVNAMILSLLYRFTPDKVRFIMIDPKMLELSVYNDIPHLLAPVVTDMKLAANALNWCVGEMEKRYRLMSALGVRNLAGYNEKVREGERAGHKLTNPFSLTPETPEPLEVLPSIVVVVDEFADLMMVAGKKIEELIARLAQKARAAGIHLILATQRPSVDVITGLIKANIPTRIAFQVSSKVDSRTILDQMGAEALLGQGDMLFLPPGSGYPQRIHGAFVTDDEVHAVVETLKSFGEPDYVEGLLTGEAELEEGAAAERNAGAESDPLYDEAVEIVLRTRKASISSVQRHLRIGYNRAARLIEEMEAAGLVSPMESNGNRSVLVPQRPE